MFDLASLVRRTALCGLLLSLPMCASDGTETDNPVIDFEATECKTHSTALTLSSEYDGLYCYAWQTLDDGALSIDVTNFMGGCYVFWDLGASRVDGSRIDLGVANNSCQIAGCGACPYDFSFKVEGVDTSQPATVQLHEYDCKGDGDAQVEPEIMLPLDERAQGMLCRTQGSGIYEAGCGRAHLPPCDESGDFGECEDGCGEGLVCVDSEERTGDRCLTACESDDDCPLEVESCQDGACQLRETF